MKVLFTVLSLSIFLNCYSQQETQNDVQSKLNKTLSFRGLSEKDITIPISTDKDKSPTNNSKLLLPKVKELMESPLKSFEFMEKMKTYDNMDILSIISSFSRMLDKRGEFFTVVEHPTFSINEKDFINSWEESLEDIRREIYYYKKNHYDDLKKNFTNEQIAFLKKNIFSIIEDSQDDVDNSNNDIFKFNAARDSSWKISKKTLEIMEKFDGGDISATEYQYFRKFLAVYLHVFKNIKNIQLLENQYISNSFVQGDFYYYLDDGDVRIAIGDAGKNIYNGHFDLIIDIGGDDVYNMSTEILTGNNFSCIMDFAGNDFYNTYSDFGLAGAVFSTSMIFDKAGNDIYKSQRGSLGAAIGGIGLLYDEAGDDIYEGNSFSQGAACFGIGLLYDKNGNDTYIANTCSQAFGMTQGIGSIIDEKGNDSYLISPRALDIGRYEDHYVSMCQGYGLGLRPYYAGGIGLLLDCEGNDIYNTDIFGQGGGYWYALGMLIDKKGNDKYNGYQYSQGSGIHLAVGLLQDDEG